MCSGRLFQATRAATQNARLPSCNLCSVYDQITTSSGTERRKVGNSGNWDAQFVAYTYTKNTVYLQIDTNT